MKEREREKKGKQQQQQLRNEMRTRQPDIALNHVCLAKPNDLIMCM